MHHSQPPQDYAKALQLIEQNPGLNLLPLLEMVVQETPDYLEAFCNQTIITVSELLRDDHPGGVLPYHVLQVIIGLHALREAFRQVRNAPAWP